MSLVTDSILLTINGGSSSIKFAAFTPGGSSKRLLDGTIDRIGLDHSTLTWRAVGGASQSNPIDASDHKQAAERLIDWMENHIGGHRVRGIGHRVVHGGLHLTAHQLVTPELIAELRRTQPLDLAHLPREIELIETFAAHFPSVPQVACVDTAFHRDLPKVAQLLPIPRHYFEAGVRRFGFHGLSYAYLMQELLRLGGEAEANGRVILAHLGSGASMAAVYQGKPIDTTMAFTPTAGLVMGTRPGDLDPGLLIYMMRVEKKTPEEMDQFISHECGLVGLSETTSDMRDLTARRQSDARADDAVAVFCYQARKWIGAYAAALGGLDTLVFAGGIGEHGVEAREQICHGLEFLSLHIDPEKNRASAPVISSDTSRVNVRVIKTDEESMIAKAVDEILSREKP